MTKTNAHTLLCVLIRAFAAYGLITVGIRVVGQLFAPPSDWEMWHRAVFYVIAIAPLIVMWIFPDWLAKLALVRKTHEVFESEVDARQLLGVALAAVGAVVVVDELIDLVSYVFIYGFYVRREGEEITSTFAHDHGTGLATTIVAIAVGCALFVGSRALARLAYRFRYGDLPQPPAGPTDAKPDES